MVTQVGTWGSESKAIRGSPRWPRPGISQLWLARIPNGTSASQYLITGAATRGGKSEFEP
ncbi:MAG TPA: hypothetical protein DHW54_00680 [Gemmatimonadetes bacterium]|nr:hypothetical protein [Gemmatimonadota bacterium]